MKDRAIWSLGTMSGTSLDGVDAAMVLTNGQQILEFGETAYRPYSPDERTTLRAALGKWQDVRKATEIVENAHAELLAQFKGAEVIGFHGQTLAHDPGGRGTFQAGNGGLLAEVLDLPVVWDFRSMDVEMGGQGAPLASFFHHACARWIGADVPLLFLNLGGVGNVTWLDPRIEKPDEDAAILAFDTGPANAPIDDLMLARLNRSSDQNGALAKMGSVDEAIISDLLNHSFFGRLPPKSLDRGAFSELLGVVANLSDADAAATLTAFCAGSVAKAVEHFPSRPEKILVAGGGRRNPVLMDMLDARMDISVEPVETVGLDGDMLEAQAFAHLAVRVLRGLPTSCPSTTGVAAAIGGGKISKPTQKA